MKLVYLTTARIPDDWAHVLQILTMCEAFGKAGVEVELLAPKRARTIAIDPYVYAGVEEVFRITKLPCIDLFPGTENSFLFYVRVFSFLIVARLYLLFRSFDVLYTREHLAGLMFNNFVYEVHSRPDAGKGLYARLWKKARAFVVLTSFMKDTYVKAGIPSTRIHIAADGVRLDEFALPVAKPEARRRLGLPEDAYLYGYVGTLKTMQMEKGVACGIDALAELDNRVRFYVVGGEQEDIDEYKAYAEREGVAERTVFVGKVAHADIPLYLAAFDVVIAPFPDFEHYRYYMSPLKIFEYLAAGVPMIVSDIPSLREILTDETAVFIPPADAHALAAALMDLRDDPQKGRALANAARADAKRFTWDARAKGILAFIRSVRD